MKKLLIMLLISISTSHAMVIESDDIKSILNHVCDTHNHEDVLVVFDIDDTLGEIKDGFGGDPWFSAMIKKKIDDGTPINVAINEVLPTYFKIQNTQWLEPVQEETPRMIRFLQQSGCHTIGGTSRSFPIKDRTHEQLEHMGIDFKKNNPCSDQFDIESDDDTRAKGRYEKGIIFSGNNNKGKMLLKYFLATQYKPKKVIFIDDKLKYVEQVKQALDDEDIAYVGIRYSRQDEKKENYCIENYDEKLKNFLISDTKVH